MNLLTAINKFTNYLINEKNRSRHTLINYVKDLNDLYRFTAHNLHHRSTKIEIENIDENLLKNFLASFIINTDIKYSKKTISRKISTIKSFFKFLNRKKVYLDNPSKKLIFPRLTKNLPYVLDERSINKLLDSNIFSTDIFGYRDRAILELLYSSGIRLSELINLKVENINFKNGSIKVIGKGDKERIIPIGKIAMDSIITYLEARDIYYKNVNKVYDKRIVFLAKSGKKLYPSLVNRITERYISKVSEIKKKSPHILRHTYATHLLNRGADIMAVKDLLGHSSLSSTQIYTHITINRLKKIYQKSHPKA